MWSFRLHQNWFLLHKYFFFISIFKTCESRRVQLKKFSMRVMVKSYSYSNGNKLIFKFLIVQLFWLFWDKPRSILMVIKLTYTFHLLLYYDNNIVLKDIIITKNTVKILINTEFSMLHRCQLFYKTPMRKS